MHDKHCGCMQKNIQLHTKRALHHSVAPEHHLNASARKSHTCTSSEHFEQQWLQRTMCARRSLCRGVGFTPRAGGPLSPRVLVLQSRDILVHLACIGIPRCPCARRRGVLRKACMV